MSIVVKRLDGTGHQLVRTGLDPGDILLDGDPAPHRKGVQHFYAHVYCFGETVAYLMQLY